MILEGKPAAEKIYQEILPKVHGLRKKQIVPHLAVILVGNREDSEIYVSIKEKRARELGMEFSLYRFSENEIKEAAEAIEYLNGDSTVHGIIIQLPLPEKFDTDNFIDSVQTQKDVDGLKEESPFQAPTPQAILDLLNFYKIELAQKKIVILGKGRLVGGPLEKLLKSKGYNSEALDAESENLLEKIKSADILIAGTGTPGIITEELVHEKMVVVSVGEEANFEQINDKVEAITPPKGGVGPITVANLLKNVVEAAEEVTSQL